MLFEMCDNKNILSDWQVLPIEELKRKAFAKFAIQLKMVQLLYVGAGLLARLCYCLYLVSVASVRSLWLH